MSRAILVLVAVALLCGGCKNVRYASEEPVPSLDDVTQGATRYGEVLGRFGAPAFLARVPNGFAMLYESARVDEESLSVSTGQFGRYGTGSGAREYLACILLFDDEGVLRQALMRGRGLDTGGGVEIATSGGAEGFAGSKDYGAGASPFGWGLRGLQPLPQLLNSRCSGIEVGIDGFELIDTPRGAGQHSLAQPVPVVEKEFR